jgi:hypothetical protein
MRERINRGRGDCYIIVDTVSNYYKNAFNSEHAPHRVVFNCAGLDHKRDIYLYLYSRELEITLISKLPRLRSRLCKRRLKLEYVYIQFMTRLFMQFLEVCAIIIRCV